MPNFVYAGFNVTGDPAEVERFRTMMFRPAAKDGSWSVQESSADKPILDFNGILPMPPEARRDQPESWAIDNWGVKWNAMDTDSRSDEPGHHWFQFTTAWDFPTPVFDALAEEFPALVFRGSAYEENHEWELVGEFNGADDWGPGEIQWILNTALGIGVDDDDDDDDDRDDEAVPF